MCPRCCCLQLYKVPKGGAVNSLNVPLGVVVNSLTMCLNIPPGVVVNCLTMWVVLCDFEYSLRCYCKNLHQKSGAGIELATGGC